MDPEPSNSPSVPPRAAHDARRRVRLNLLTIKALRREALGFRYSWFGPQPDDPIGLDYVVVAGIYQALPGEEVSRARYHPILTNRQLGRKAQQPEWLKFIAQRMAERHPELLIFYAAHPSRRPRRRPHYDYTVTSATKVLTDAAIHCGPVSLPAGTLIGWVFTYSDGPGFYLSDGPKRSPHRRGLQEFDSPETAIAHRREASRRFFAESIMFR